MLEFGLIKQIKKNKALAIVDILGRKTNWLPFLSTASSFKKHFCPLRVGDQVAVLDDRLIIGTLFFKGLDEPQANKAQEVILYEDGTKISYDTEAKTLKIEAVGKINIICSNASIKADAIKVDARSASVKASKVEVDSQDINLGLGGFGVVTGECLCPFTGNPHADFSACVKALK